MAWSDIEFPDGSIYFWMYVQGLKHVPLEDIVTASDYYGRDIRDKDERNYWAGYYNSDLYGSEGRARNSILSIDDSFPRSRRSCFELEWDEYPEHPYLSMPDPPNRWVPCTNEGKPLIKWGNGCLLRSEAEAYRGSKTLAENLKGCKKIVIDFDCDHDEDNIDLELVRYAYNMSLNEHALYKPKQLCSYEGYGWTSNEPDFVGLMFPSVHVTFYSDKVIPTMHFPKAHIDIIGNQKNSIRYFKNKVWNGNVAKPMTPNIWSTIMEYIESKES